MPPPLGSKFFQFHAVFGALPPRGNPGSATVHFIEKKFKTQIISPSNKMTFSESTIILVHEQKGRLSGRPILLFMCPCSTLTVDLYEYF